MVSPAVGSVILITFPFSDLSSSKLRPAVVIASSGQDDWILCQITSNPYADPLAIKITEKDFFYGSLHRVSYARPGKLFTANSSIIKSEVARLDSTKFENVITGIVSLIKGNSL